MYVNAQTRTVILTPPRTGSRSIREAALANGFDVVGSHHEVVPDAIPRNADVWCTFRSHWDVFASWYCADHRARGRTLGAWWRDWWPDYVRTHQRDGMGDFVQHGSLYGYYLPHVTHFVFYPKLNPLMTATGANALPHVKDGHSRRTERAFVQFYDIDTVQMIADEFADEISALGFRFPRKTL